MEECDTVGEECWNDTVCVNIDGSPECMIRCAENEECVAAYGPEYQCDDDGVCKCFENTCPR